MSEANLARSLQETWRSVERAGLPLEPALFLDEALLELDYERTYGEDIEADVGPGQKVYETTVMSLAKVSGGVLSIWAEAGQEDWDSESDHVTVKVQLAAGQWIDIRLRQLGDFVDPNIVRGINSALPGDGPRFWFFDNGGQHALVVRATHDERRALSRGRGTQLMEDPPSWWEPAPLATRTGAEVTTASQQLRPAPGVPLGDTGKLNGCRQRRPEGDPSGLSVDLQGFANHAKTV